MVQTCLFILETFLKLMQIMTLLELSFYIAKMLPKMAWRETVAS